MSQPQQGRGDALQACGPPGRRIFLAGFPQQSLNSQSALRGQVHTEIVSGCKNTSPTWKITSAKERQPGYTSFFPAQMLISVVLVYSTCHEGYNPSIISAEKACSHARAHDALSAQSSRKACSPHQHLIGNMPCRVSYSPGETFMLIHTNWYSCEKYQIPWFWKLYLPLFPDVKLIVILDTSGIWDACSEVMVTHINTLLTFLWSRALDEFY